MQRRIYRKLYGQGDMKEWSTKNGVAERAAAEPSLDYWSGDTSALEANIQQHWADISSVYGKLMAVVMATISRRTVVGNYTLIIVFPNYVQDFLGVVQRAKKSYYKSNYASFKYVKENITGAKLQYEGTYNGSPYKWSLGGEEANGGFANFD